MKGLRMKSTFAAVCFVLMFSVFWAASLPAQDPPSQTPRTATTPASSVHDSYMNEGLRNNAAYSYLLYNKAKAADEDRLRLLNEALLNAPDVPFYYFAVAKTGFSFSPDGIFRSINNTSKGLTSYGRSFWWSNSLYALLIVCLLAAFLVTAVVVIVIRAPMDIDLLRHDLMEDRTRLAVLAVVIASSILGPVFFVASALCAIGLYMRRIDKAIVYLILVVLLTSPVLLSMFDKYASAPSPVVRALVEVKERYDNNYPIQVLGGRRDFATRFSYATALKRAGRCEEAERVFEELLTKEEDPRVYINLANCNVALRRLEEAKQLYHKAEEINPSVVVYYNLSQVYRETLDYEKGDEYYTKAIQMNEEMVKTFFSFSSPNPNRLVIDEKLTDEEIYAATERRDGNGMSPYPLGPYSAGLGAVLLIAVFAIFDGIFKVKAFKCTKCGITLCNKCAKDVPWGNMCGECYTSVVKIDSKASKRRVSRLLEIYERQQKRRGLIKVLSFLPPGIAYIYAGKIFQGVLLLCPFLMLLLIVTLNPLINMGLDGFTHSWLSVPSILAMALLYVLTGMVVRRRLDRGWL